MSLSRSAIVALLLLPYLCMFGFMVFDPEGFRTMQAPEFVVTSAFLGLMPLIAAFILRRPNQVTSARFIGAVAALGLPLLLIVVVKTFGETVPEKFSGCSGNNVPTEVVF